MPVPEPVRAGVGGRVGGGVSEAVRAVVRNHLRRAGPTVLLMALATGVATVLGGHVYNAWPTAGYPHGEPGPANLERAVAYVRPALVLTTSLPALLLGLRSAAGLDAARGWGPPMLRVGADLLLLAVGAAVAALIGAWATAEAPAEAIVALAVSTMLLAWSFHAMAFAAGVILPGRAALPATGLWLVFHGLYESLVRWRLFRATGYYELRAGQLPIWFVAAQALSPLAAYRGLMILWRPGFRDGLERETLRNATLPGWLGPEVLAIMLLLWTVVPLALAAAVWARRTGVAARAAAQPESAEEDPGDDPAWVRAWYAQSTTRPRQ